MTLRSSFVSTLLKFLTTSNILAWFCSSLAVRGICFLADFDIIVLSPGPALSNAGCPDKWRTCTLQYKHFRIRFRKKCDLDNTRLQPANHEQGGVSFHRGPNLRQHPVSAAGNGTSAETVPSAISNYTAALSKRPPQQLCSATSILSCLIRLCQSALRTPSATVWC